MDERLLAEDRGPDPGRAAPTAERAPLLQIEDLHTCIETPDGVVRAVDGVGLTIGEGEVAAIVGESGCGKSMTALSVLQLVPEPGGYIETGRIRFRGTDLLDLTWEEMREFRGRHIGMVFQEPMTSLNAVFTVGAQLVEAATVHGVPRRDARSRAIELLARVHLEHPEQVLRQYPHELSGGMRQRAMIAMALMNQPALLVADEPTTALDVTVQAQILALLGELQREMGMAILLITHDLGIVAEITDRVAVMYAGEIVEVAPTATLFKEPLHPYTRGLFASLPSRQRRGSDLVAMEGVVPDPLRWPEGCRFAARCPQRFEGCDVVHPRLQTPGTVPVVESQRHQVRCRLYEG